MINILTKNGSKGKNWFINLKYYLEDVNTFNKEEIKKYTHIILKNPTVNKKFIDGNVGILSACWDSWQLISEHSKHIDEFVSRECLLFPKNMSSNPYISFDLFDKFKSILHVPYYAELYDWTELSKRTDLTVEIIEKYKNKWKWEVLSQNICFTMDMIEQFFDQISWVWLSKNPNITIEIVEKYWEEFSDIAWWNLSATLKLTDYVLEKYKRELFQYSSCISENKSLTLEIIEKHNEYWSWNSISSNITLTNQVLLCPFIIKGSLSRNPSLTIEMIEKYGLENSLDFGALSTNLFEKDPYYRNIQIKSILEKIVEKDVSFNIMKYVN